jgi:hypothetical protein
MSRTAPRWAKPQPTQLVEAAPEVEGWLREIKRDGHPLHASNDGSELVDQLGACRHAVEP